MNNRIYISAKKVKVETLKDKKGCATVEDSQPLVKATLFLGNALYSDYDFLKSSCTNVLLSNDDVVAFGNLSFERIESIFEKAHIIFTICEAYEAESIKGDTELRYSFAVDKDSVTIGFRMLALDKNYKECKKAYEEYLNYPTSVKLIFNEDTENIIPTKSERDADYYAAIKSLRNKMV